MNEQEIKSRCFLPVIKCKYVVLKNKISKIRRTVMENQASDL